MKNKTWRIALFKADSPEKTKKRSNFSTPTTDKKQYKPKLCAKKEFFTSFKN